MEQLKYRLIGAPTEEELEHRINALSEEYSLRDYFYANNWWRASMSLREESKYDNIEKYKKVEITTQEQTIPEGWSVIHHTSKEFILVKKSEQSTATIEQVGVGE